MQTLAILLAGYSIFSAAVIAVTHFRRVHYPGQNSARLVGLLLLAELAGMQALNVVALQNGFDAAAWSIYRVLLFAVAPAFYLFSRPLLTGEMHFRPRQLTHFLPVLVAPLLPASWALTLAFAIGALYLSWLARSVYALRSQRSRFRLELSILGFVFMFALVALLAALSLRFYDQRLFYELYAGSIGGGFLMVGIVLGLAPRIADDVSEAARETYAVTTLAQVDCPVMLAELAKCMEQDQIFRQADLDLRSMAARLGLSSHQLSELINTRLGMSFSRYLREQRINAAKILLIAEPAASVLSVGMSVGFSSQSNFYDAFHEITGMTPGNYRKIRLRPAPE